MQLPKTFLQQIQDQLGDELPAFLEALSHSVPVSIHFNKYKPFRKKENFNGVKWYNKGVYLSERPSFTLDPAFHAGAYYVQEASSMLIAAAVEQIVDLHKPLKVLDLCAAPGGKSTLLASLLSKDSLLFANEVIRSRYQVLDYNLTKWGIVNKISTQQDVNQFSGLEGYFDLILVDAPCSGEGLFRKTPSAISEWSVEHVKHCSGRQKRILGQTIDLLKPGGVLLYSTCTYNDTENSENGAWMLQSFPLEITPLHFPTDWGIRSRPVGYQCYPHLVMGEGFYLAAFTKTEDPSPGRPSKYAKNLKYLEVLPKAQKAVLSSWVRDQPNLVYLQDRKGKIRAFPEHLYNDLLRLSPYLKYFRAGTPIGQFKGKDLVPDPALALSTIIHPDIPSLQVDRDQALQFLRKENLKLDVPTGWQILQFEGLHLGWIKGLKHRINNYYPKEWKIRMK